MAARIGFCGALISLLAATGAQTPGEIFNGSTLTGFGTYYGGNVTSGGACTLSDWFASLTWAATGGGGDDSLFWPVAMNTVQWAGSEACGMCVATVGTGTGSGFTPLPTTKIRYGVVVDWLPIADSGSIDYNGVGDGRWGIEWYPVACPVDSEPFSYRTAGSNPYYLKLQVRNERFPVASVALDANGDGVFTPLTRSQDNFFVYTPDFSTGAPGGEGLITGPVSLRITSVLGDVVTETGITLPLGTDTPVTGTVQFPLHLDIRVGFGPNPLPTAPGASSLV